LQVKPFRDIDSQTIKSKLDDLEKIGDLNKAVQISITVFQAISSVSTLQQSEITKVKT